VKNLVFRATGVNTGLPAPGGHLRFPPMGRLIFGLLKGLLIGGLIGGALVAAGMAVPSAFILYAAAAVTAAVVALVAGKKVWEADGRIQVLLKTVAGLGLGPGLLWLVRSFANFPLPDLSALPGASSVPGVADLPAHLTAGSFAVTALALVAATLAGLYDLDNTPAPATASGAKSVKGKSGKPAQRIVDPEIAALTGLDAAEIEAAEAETEERKTRKAQ
jgi:hypothetical protein